MPASIEPDIEKKIAQLEKSRLMIGIATISSAVLCVVVILLFLTDLAPALRYGLAAAVAIMDFIGGAVIWVSTGKRISALRNPHS